MRAETPEAYRVGWVPFLGLKIWLDSRPLIPRPETEWWTKELIKNFSKSPRQLRVLDLCAGSGAIGCALLASVPNAKVSFGELERAHEATIRKNIRKNGLDATRADIRIGDLFAPFAGEQFDSIAANPPYVPEGRALPASVHRYEPALALRAGADGLAVIRRIAQALPEHLARTGCAWIECDSAHAAAVCALFRSTGFRAQVMHDQYARPRIVVVSFP